jgi:hypothetical protein
MSDENATENEDAIEETIDETTEEVEASEYDKPLYTGDLGGHVLHDSGDTE